MWHWLRSIVRRQHERRIGRRSAVLKHTRYASRPLRSARLLLQALEERTVPTVSVFNSSNQFVRNYSGADAIQQGIHTPSAATLIVYNDEYYADFIVDQTAQTIVGRDVNTTYGTFQFQSDANVAALGNAVAPVGNAPATQPTIIASGTGTTVSFTGSNNSIDNLNIVDGNEFNPTGVLVAGNNETITNSTIELHDRGVVVNAGVNGLEIANSSIVDNTQEGLRFNGGTTTQNVSIHNDFITGNVTSGTATFAGVRFAPTYSGNNVNFFYDELSGNGGSGAVLDQSTVANSTGKSGDVNFSFDWWGSASGPSGATIGGIAAPGTGGKVSSRVDVTPYLISGDVDANATNGFQPSVATLNVTAYDVQTGTLGRIQEAVGDPSQPGAVPGVSPAGGVAVGGTVNVAAGTFHENVSVNKALTIDGANAGAAGSASRGAESIVVTNGNNSGGVFNLSASNITIDGLTIEGDDPAVAGVSLTSGADANATYGFRATGAFSQLTVENNIVKDVAIGFRGDGSASGNSITRNWFDSIGFYDFGYAVSLRNNFYADVTNNLMTRVQSGLHTNNFFGATGPASWLFQGNTVQAYGAGVWDNLQYNGATSLTIDNNHITSLVAPNTPANAAVRGNFDGKSIGILLVSIQDAVGVNITNNTIDGMGYGLVAYNTVTSNTVTPASSNTIENSTAAGVYLTNIVGFNPVTTTVLGGTANNPTGVGKVNLTGLALTGNATGVLVHGDNAATAFGVSLTLGAGDTITGGLTGLQLTGGMAAVTGGNLNNLAFTGQTGTGWRYITLTNGALSGGELNATAASFDGFVGPASALPASLATFYAKEDRIDDAIDAPGVGFVRLKSGQVFVTQQSETTNADAIQRGVNAASAGDTVNVAAGTFVGQVAVSGKNLSIVGGGAGSTIIQAPNTLVTNFTTSGPNKAVVFFANANDSISNLTIDGNKVGDANNRLVGLAYHDAGGTVDGVTIENVSSNPLNGVQAGTGILAVQDAGAAMLTITHDTIVGYQKNGMTLAGTGLTVDVGFNTVTGAGATTLIAQNGIQLSGGAGGAIHDNTISGNNYTPAPQSTGVLLFGALASSSVTGNTISNSDYGVYAYAGAGPGTTLISGNTVSGAAAAGIGVNGGAVQISQNTLQNGADGIDLFGNLSGTSLHDNLIQGNSGTGILVDSGATATGPISVTLNSIHGNHVGLDNESLNVTVNADHDWWGSANGPTNASNPVNVGSQGDSVIGPGATNFTPWLTSGQNDATGPGFVPHSVASFAPVTNDEGGGFLTIQSAVNGTDANHTIFVSAGTYRENVTVNKSLTLLGPNAGTPGNGSRTGEAIVEPATTQTSNQGSTSGVIFRVGSGSSHIDVTIDGFTIDGHNAALTGGRVLNGVEVDTGAGIANSIGSFDANPGGYDVTLTADDNIIQNLERYGVLIDNTADRAAKAGNEVSFNKIDNLPSGNNFGGDRGRGAAFEENVYGSFTHNVVTRVNVGWQDDNYNLAAPGAGTLVDSNTISTYHRGIFHNLQYQNATPITISNNSISVETNGDFPATTTNFGIELASIQSGVGATVTNNNDTGNVYGIMLWNLPTTADITISGGTLTGNFYGVWATSTDPQFGPAAASHAIVSGVNIVNASGAGIAVDDANDVAGTALTVTGNTTVSGGPIGILVTGPGAALAFTGATPANLTGNANDIVLSNGAMAGQAIDATAVWFDGFVGGPAPVATATDLAAFYALENKITDVLDGSGVGFVRLKNGYVFVAQQSETSNANAVQRGAGAAINGDSVELQAGTFAGQVVVDGKDLSIIGAGANQTTIAAPDTLFTNFITSGPNKAVVFFTNSDSGNISDLTIDGRGVGDANNRLVGLAYDNAGGTVDGLTIEHIRGNPLNGVQAGNAILAVNGDSVARTLTITNNTIFDYQKNGMTLTGAGLTVDVGNNTVTGAGPTNQIAQNGIELAFGAGGSIHGNTISSDSYTGTQPADSTGVLLFQAAQDSSVTGNTISGSDIGIYAGYNGTPGHAVTISGNQISGSAAAGIFAAGGAFDISLNTVENGVANGGPANNNGDGIDLFGDMTGTSLHNNLIQSNTGTGIFLAGPASGYPATDSAGPLTISFNSISGNATAGLDNESAVTVNAADNWWGSANGPTNPANTFNVGSQGDKIVGPGTTTYVPWLASGQNNATESGFVPVSGASFAPVTNDEGGFFSSIQAGINGTDPGHTVFVSAGTFSENVNVDKPLTIEGAGSSASGTIVHAASGNVVTVSANNVTLDHLRITGTGSTNGVFFDSAVNGTTLSDVVSTGHSDALEIHNSAVVTNLTLTSVDLSSSAIGFRVATTGQVSGMTVTGGNFSNNQYGLYTNADLSSVAAAAANAAGFQHVTFSGTTFAGNDAQRAMYFEKLNDVTFTNVTVTANKTGNVIDVNLKNGVYAGLHFNGGSVTNAGTGTDLYIKGRNDGGNASTPGNLTDVTLHNLTVTSGGTDVAFQNNVTLANSALSGLTLNGTGTGIGFFGSDAASTPDMPSQTFALNDTNFAGSLAAYVVDTTHNNVDGTAATFGGIAGGNTLTVANGFAIADKIVDGVDASTNGFNSLGLVRLRVGQVYVTPNSFYAPLGTTAASIQRGVNVASANDTVNVEAGSYTGDVRVNKSLTLLGAQAGVDPVPGRAGAESIIMGAGVHAPVQIAAGTNNVVIDGFTIQSPAGGSGDLNAGIWTNGSTGLTIRYDIIQNNTAGIAIGDSGGSIAHNVIRTNNGPGAGGGNGVEFFTGSGSSGWTVSNNLFTGNDNADVQIAAGATVANVVITANQFVNSTGNPLYALQADNLTFSGNTITGAAFSGVYFGGEVTNSSITGNTFTNNHSRAIYAGLYPGLTANANVTISGNTITQDATLITSPRAMIDLEAGAGVSTVSGNTITVSNLTTQQITGIGLAGTGASSVLIQNNTIKGTADGVSGAKTGISIGAGSTATLLGNTVHGGTGTGRIGVTVGGTVTLGDDTAGGADVITGWSSSNADGVQVTAAGAATLLMNTITGNNFGVIVNGGKALLQDNDLRNNKTNGVSSAGLDVRNNAMVDAGQDNPATPTIEGTNFTGLGISKGGNLFNWALTSAGGYSQLGAKAIVNENDFSGTLPTDAAPVQAPNVPAQYNNFGTTVYGNIEQIVFHYYDSGKALVDYRNAVGATAPTLEVVSPGSINPLLRVFAVDPTVNSEVGLVNQRSIIRAIQFQVDSPVALGAGAVDLTRVGAASYPWYASALPTGAVPISTEADIDGSTGRTTVTVRYTTPNTGAFNGSMTEWGSLVDGNYNLGFHGAAAELLFVGSGTIAQDHTDSLFRFYGDTNGTRTLNSADTAVLRLAIANQPNDPTRFLDLNQNGAIDPFESQDNPGNPAAAGEYFRRLRQGAFLPPSP